MKSPTIGYFSSGGCIIAWEEIIREKGTNRARFFRKQVDKYLSLDVGSSFVMSDPAYGVCLRIIGELAADP